MKHEIRLNGSDIDCAHLQIDRKGASMFIDMTYAEVAKLVDDARQWQREVEAPRRNCNLSTVERKIEPPPAPKPTLTEPEQQMLRHLMAAVRYLSSDAPAMAKERCHLATRAFNALYPDLKG